ncbi:hypothetical protein HOE22_04340 [Candidatus Woesearchaeota archaeon]|nr:hypothetical protein [Candidatus Woesearchaeota archaeon]MBT4732484.1 hypothetical protein [Candidatus Woesearchaeota archaeon]MBT7558371.1 hypothetical protein [Candidatus Woesearchaeota archaeon]
MKKLGVVVSGWHFPINFYQQIIQQTIPLGWEVDYFCVSHRDPSIAKEEKKNILTKLGDGTLERLDKILYEDVPSVDWLENAGWNYSLEPNNCGDWAVTNQWLEKYDYKDYEMLLLTHDDNFLLNNHLFVNTLDNTFPKLFRNDYSLNDLPEFKNATKNDYSEVEPDDWLLLSNAIVNWTGKVRGSFDFFKTELIEKLGGSFDMSRVELDRTGKTDSMDMTGMKDWEKPIQNFHGFMYDNQLLDKIRYLSPTYRASSYCLEGERGLLSNTSTPQGVIYRKVVDGFQNEGLLDV